MSTALPEGTHLAYIITHEAWYARSLPDDRREVNVIAAADGGGCAWEFTVEEVDLGSHGRPIRVKVFDDAFAAFKAIPRFFQYLASDGITTLEDATRLLDGLGAKDETERRGPDGATPVIATSRRIRKAIEDAPDLDAATAAVMRALGMEGDPR